MYVKTGRPEFDNLIPLVKGFLEKDILDVVIDGQKIRGYRSPDSKAIWLRDYSDMIRAFRYFEKDLQSTIRHFADTQSHNGRIFDYFTTFPEKLPCEKENWTKYVRVPVEADVEYSLIKAAWISWQSTGDDEFIKELLIEYLPFRTYIKYNYLSSYKSVKLEIEGTPEVIDLELYLPENKKSVSVNVTGGDIQTINEYEPEDQYFRCIIKKFRTTSELTILLSGK